MSFSVSLHCHILISDAFSKNKDTSDKNSPYFLVKEFTTFRTTSGEG